MGGVQSNKQANKQDDKTIVILNKVDNTKVGSLTFLFIKNIIVIW